MAGNRLPRDQHKDKLRQEAKERQIAHNKLTPEGKLAKLDAAGWNAQRERQRLEAEIAALAEQKTEE